MICAYKAKPDAAIQQNYVDMDTAYGKRRILDEIAKNSKQYKYPAYD